ncbi:MAG: Txe/YoeB family addiction module toxin [Rhodococcus sp.]|nr:Txe/YoeB family addiction module toxin [Rhodococcus sp. (in: high G+C Gram-positive bacteria)]
MKRKLTFTPTAWNSYVQWQTDNRSVTRSINKLIKAILRDPFEGPGKPEPLKHQLAGAWSRRITYEHRLVYLVDGHQITVISVKYHY